MSLTTKLITLILAGLLATFLVAGGILQRLSDTTLRTLAAQNQEA
jgi:hypothetical protein